MIKIASLLIIVTMLSADTNTTSDINNSISFNEIKEKASKKIDKGISYTKEYSIIAYDVASKKLKEANTATKEYVKEWFRNSWEEAKAEKNKK